MERQGTDANLKEKSKCEALSSNPGPKTNLNK
jgi:hypothetical protein